MRKPNATGKVMLFVVAVAILIVIGFIIGQIATAINTLPGNSDDPVATQSYVETTVGERLAILTTRIEELEAEVATLKSGATTTTPDTSTTTTPTTVTPSTTDGSTTGTITGSTVNVRSGPGTDYSKVGSVAKGDKVKILSTDGNWYRISIGNVTGYVSAEYVSK